MIPRADDQAGTGDERLGEALADDVLTKRFQRAVGVEPNLLGLLGKRRHGAVLAERACVLGVHRHCRDECVVADLTQGVDRLAHDAWDITARVDDRVEVPVCECAEVAVAVADQLFDAGEQLGSCLAAVEERDLMAALEGGLDHMAAEELRSSEDEHAHSLTLCT